MLPPYPTALNTGCLRLSIAAEAIAGTQINWMQFNYITSGDFPPGTTTAVFNAASVRYMHATFAAIWDNPFDPTYFYWNVNTVAGHWKFQPSYLTITWTGRRPVNQASGLSIILRTSNMSRNGIARIHYPMMRDEDHDGSRVLPAAGTLRLNNFLLFLVNPFTILGVTFQPAVWSRQLNTMFPIISAEISPMTMTLRKRRPKAFKTHTNIIL